jgi:hypothetical protein
MGEDPDASDDDLYAADAEEALEELQDLNIRKIQSMYEARAANVASESFQGRARTGWKREAAAEAGEREGWRGPPAGASGQARGAGGGRLREKRASDGG